MPWILLVQHETTCKPSSMEPIDEPQTLLLANGKIQHSHTIGDSKAPLAVKDSGHHHVPVLNKWHASVEHIASHATD